MQSNKSLFTVGDPVYHPVVGVGVIHDRRFTEAGGIQVEVFTIHFSNTETGRILVPCHRAHEQIHSLPDQSTLESWLRKPLPYTHDRSLGTWQSRGNKLLQFKKEHGIPGLITVTQKLAPKNTQTDSTTALDSEEDILDEVLRCLLDIVRLVVPDCQSDTDAAAYLSKHLGRRILIPRTTADALREASNLYQAMTRARMSTRRANRPSQVHRAGGPRM